MKITRRSFIGGAIALSMPIITGVKGSIRKVLAAQSQAGKLVFYSGRVSVNGRSAILGGAIRSGDRLATGDRSAAEVILGDRSIMRIRENTQVDFSEFGDEVKANVSLGKVLSIVQKTGKGFKIATPTVVASVAGTVFFVEASPDATYLCACNGSIDVLSSLGAEDKEGNVTGTHHTAVNISKKDGLYSIDSEVMKNHSNEEIADLEKNFLKYREP